MVEKVIFGKGSGWRLQFFFPAEVERDEAQCGTTILPFGTVDVEQASF